MKKLSALTAAVLCLATLSLFAQTAQSKPAKTVASKSARAAPPLNPNPLTPPASAEQIDAAERTHFGDYECEFGQTIHVSLDPTAAGYVEVKLLKKLFTMKPVLSSTGALRLEDVRGQTMLLQIANKSMLMDVKAGRRLVDDCVHAVQREFNSHPPVTVPMLK